jgi:ATP-binding protein involved in chromosome partitioning
VLAVLRGVVDPELGSDIVDLGMAQDARVDPDGTVHLRIALTTAGCPLRAQISGDARARVSALPGVQAVHIDWAELSPADKARTMERARWHATQQAGTTAIPATAKVIAIASGKGGVGKSSVTVNLAAALADRGLAVGVIDADIWGFSIPRMLGVEGRLGGRTEGDRKVIVPASKRVGAGRLDVVSMGFLVDSEESALLWRGLMLNRAVQHFLEDVDWAPDLDYVLIDMPPGTGDVALGLARMLPRAELLVVTTPARSAQKVAERAVTMARKSFLRVAGVVENMSVFVTEDGRAYELFGSGGGEELARAAGVPLLGRIPIEPGVAAGGDSGRPVVLDDGPASRAFQDLATRIVTDVIPPVAMAGCTARMLQAAEAALDALDA